MCPIQQTAPAAEAIAPPESAPVPDGRIRLLGSPLDPVDMKEAVARCRAAIDGGGYLQHMSINAAKLVSMRGDEELRRGVKDGGLITADGQSVVWAARLLGTPLPERVAGIDLMHEMLRPPTSTVTGSTSSAPARRCSTRRSRSCVASCRT